MYRVLLAHPKMQYEYDASITVYGTGAGSAIYTLIIISKCKSTRCTPLTTWLSINIMYMPSADDTGAG